MSQNNKCLIYCLPLFGFLWPPPNTSLHSGTVTVNKDQLTVVTLQVAVAEQVSGFHMSVSRPLSAVTGFKLVMETSGPQSFLCHRPV